METTPQGGNLFLETPLRAKPYQAARTIPRPLQWRLFTIGLVVSDVIMAAIAFRLAYYVRFELSLNFLFQNIKAGAHFYQQVAMFLIPIWIFIFYLSGLYDRQKLLGGTKEYSSLFNGITFGMALLIVAGFLRPDFIFARGWLVLAWLYAFLLIGMGRFTIRRVVYALRRKGFFLSSAVIVGANNEGLSLAEQLLTTKASGFQIIGFIDKKLPLGTTLLRNLQVLGNVDQLDEIIEHYEVEELILASSAISSRDRMLDIFQKYGISSEVNVRMSSGLYEIITTGLTIKEFAYVPLVGVNKVRLTGVDELLKLGLDLAITIPGLIILSPVLLLIALLIKLDSPGPVIHRRRVMGVNGRQFDAYKFRTMYVNGDEILEAHPKLKSELARNFKLKNDPRVTRTGSFLRKSSIDELPQLFNVLKRQMSWVGPRIITPAEVEKYNKWDINLLTVRPGITGLWQVSGRSDVSYEERVRLDMHYIRNWSIWFDLQILFQTIPAVIKRRGAY